MADAVEVAIEAALLARAQSFAAAQSPALTIAMPNVAFTPPTPGPAAKYLRATFLPNDTDTLSVPVNGSNKHYGLLQIDVFYGIGGGELAPGRVAAALIAYFKRDTSIERDNFTVQVLTAPLRGPLITDGAWAFIPVRIPYCCFASNPA